MFFGCCASIDNYSLIATGGFQSIILPATEVVAMKSEKLRYVKERLERGPLKCETLNSFCTTSLKLCGNGYDQEALDAYCISLAKKASYLGIRYIGVGAPGSRSLEDGFSRTAGRQQLKNSFKIMSGVFKKYGIDVLLEPVCSLECNFITTTYEALALINELRLDNLFLVYDIYHAQAMQENAVPLYRARGKIKVVHIAENINNKRRYLKPDYIEKHRPYAQALIEIKYDGEVAVEAFDEIEDVYLIDSLKILKELFL